MLVSAALVLFMTPGLALFYGGMVRSKHVLSMLAQNFAVIAVRQHRVGARRLQRSRSAATPAAA